MIAGMIWNANTTPRLECCLPISPNTNSEPAYEKLRIFVTVAPSQLKIVWPTGTRSTKIANSSCNPTPHAISRRVVAWGVGLQLLFAIFVLRVPVGQTIFSWLGATVTKILSFSYAGSEFVFGEIGKQHSSLGVIFAFQIMPAIIFVSALFAIMYYLGIMQVVVKAFAWLMNKIMGASGAESLNVAASIFMG